MARRWLLIVAGTALAIGARTQGTATAAKPSRMVQSPAEAAISKGIGGLRSLPDDERAKATKALALQIRALPAGPSKVGLAYSLSNLATEGDFGPGTLQTVADTLVQALKETPASSEGPYVQVANLARYEDIRVDLDAPLYRKAMEKVEATDQARAKADFTLTDRNGKAWTRSSLKGKVVLVNFWATWCPPCRKEMPDLDALDKRFRDQGLVILGISDEKPETVDAYLRAHPVGYNVLLDPGRKVNDLYQVDGIPKNLVYDRKGRLVAQSIDMRTMRQFLTMLAKAGLR